MISSVFSVYQYNISFLWSTVYKCECTNCHTLSKIITGMKHYGWVFSFRGRYKGKKAKDKDYIRCVNVAVITRFFVSGTGNVAVSFVSRVKTIVSDWPKWKNGESLIGWPISDRRFQFLNDQLNKIIFTTLTKQKPVFSFWSKIGECLWSSVFENKMIVVKK